MNLPASVHQRLLRLSQERETSFNLLLVQYGNERLLYRLSRSPYAQRFVLKGALVFAVWQVKAYRPTRDLDLLGYGDSSREAIAQVFQDICTLPVEADGLVFDTESIRVSEIREEQEYGGLRVTLTARLGKARIPLRIDIGFGDVVSPSPVEVIYPTLLGSPAPRLRTYSKETIVAEKLQAMISLGFLNSRLKDFYDVWVLSREFSFDGTTLCQAIRATFAHRSTAVPQNVPTALTAAFGEDAGKNKQWEAFLARGEIDAGDIRFSEVIGELARFLLPVLSAIGHGEEFGKSWPPRGPWTE